MRLIDFPEDVELLFGHVVVALDGDDDQGGKYRADCCGYHHRRFAGLWMWHDVAVSNSCDRNKRKIERIRKVDDLERLSLKPISLNGDRQLKNSDNIGKGEHAGGEQDSNGQNRLSLEIAFEIVFQIVFKSIFLAEVVRIWIWVYGEVAHGSYYEEDAHWHSGQEVVVQLLLDLDVWVGGVLDVVIGSPDADVYVWPRANQH